MNEFGRPEQGLDKALNFVTGNVHHCRQSCMFQTMDNFISSSNYPAVQVFDSREDFCLIITKIITVCKDPERRTVLELKYGSNYCAQFTSSPCHANNSLIEGRLSEAQLLNLKDSVVIYATDNVAKIKIFFKDPFYTQILRERKLTEIQAFGSLGGMLGLLLGFSIISLVEIFYHCMLGVRSFFNLYWNSKKNH